MITAGTKVVDVIDHPLFSGFGRLIFPTAFGRPDPAMTLRQVGSLLLYHHCVRAETTVDVIRALLCERAQGRPLFYHIYTEQERTQDPAKRDTGLFFFPGKPGAPFAILCAGGAFYYVASIHESLPHALALSRQGYNAFALVYRTRDANAACSDLARAIRFVFTHADELGVCTTGYSLWGGSAGARMAAYLGSYGTKAFGEGDFPRPGAVVMQYTGHTHYTRHDPPTYACVGGRDGIADWRVMKGRLDCMDRLGIDTAFHLYSSMPHGFGLGIGTEAEGWLDEAVEFWCKHIKV